MLFQRENVDVMSF